MENCRKSLLLLVLSAFFMAFSVPAHAESVEEKKAAANYDETLPESSAASEEAAPSQPEPVVSQEVPEQVTVPPTSETLEETSAAENPNEIPADSSAQTEETAAPQPEPAVPAVAPAQVVVRQAPVPAFQAAAPQAPVAAPQAAVPQAPVTAPQAAPQETPETEVFTPSNVSGIVEVSGYKYPVYLFVPKDYKTDRTYPMIMIAPAESAKAEKQIEYLSGLAQRKSIFILAPYVLWPKKGDTPYTLDNWLLTVKKDVMDRFPISKKRVYLVGKDLGGHYAAYLATKYPNEFTAAALIGEAWDGPFSELIQPRSDAADQIPFLVALKTDGDARSRNQSWLGQLQKKGYAIHVVDYKSDEELNDLEFKKSVFEWMETTGQNWEAAVSQEPKSWKAKFKRGVKDFFAV